MFDQVFDFSIGTSENGDSSLDDPAYQLPPFKHLLIVFGGVQGLEQAVEDSEQLQVERSKTRFMFDVYLNTCAEQGSRTIRCEEAILISLAMLRPRIVLAGRGCTEEA